VPDHDATDVEVAEQLEQEAQRLLDNRTGGDSLALAIDQLQADRANGEPLTTAIRQLREAIAEHRDLPAGGTQQ
jgi:hypothetical protein